MTEEGSLRLMRLTADWFHAAFIAPQVHGSAHGGEAMEIGHEVERLPLRLEFHGGADHPELVPETQRPGGLDFRHNAGRVRHHRDLVQAPSSRRRQSRVLPNDSAGPQRMRPRPNLPRRVVAHVLRVSANELRNPVLLLVLVVPHDLTVHVLARLDSN
jgi:hypothetical protein